ncbi:unnamed protein product [Vitrella brassicaformis CCMP3155]|uniref:Uncharacterized protein n=1 Tax=Vitrella brassicaformis (strain CCMP3155) TaxID=1169540 RepID=A0A0G4ENQ6_VITBC|nr:unnamed protein product [Vitrella brassicaformis CCMP3155]|eukprot:CEL99238.1 unnamed protein product [Vitrella brassicaformis CCMP3155]
MAKPGDRGSLIRLAISDLYQELQWCLALALFEAPPLSLPTITSPEALQKFDRILTQPLQQQQPSTAPPLAAAAAAAGDTTQQQQQQQGSSADQPRAAQGQAAAAKPKPKPKVKVKTTRASGKGRSKKKLSKKDREKERELQKERQRERERELERVRDKERRRRERERERAASGLSRESLQRMMDEERTRLRNGREMADVFDGAVEERVRRLTGHYTKLRRFICGGEDPMMPPLPTSLKKESDYGREVAELQQASAFLDQQPLVLQRSAGEFRDTVECGLRWAVGGELTRQGATVAMGGMGRGEGHGGADDQGETDRPTHSMSVFVWEHVEYIGYVCVSTVKVTHVIVTRMW